MSVDDTCIYHALWCATAPVNRLHHPAVRDHIQLALSVIMQEVVCSLCSETGNNYIEVIVMDGCVTHLGLKQDGSGVCVIQLFLN